MKCQLLDVQERGQRVEPQSPVRASRDDNGCEEGHEEEHEKECREQAAGPAGPERTELDREGLAPFPDEE